MRPHSQVSASYLKAFADLVSRIARSLKDTPAELLPVRMYVAGGAALMLHLGARVSEDIDATFSRRVVLLDDLSVSYQDADGKARVLYLDRNYNDTLGLLHEDAYNDSVRVTLPGVTNKIIEVRVLSPLDLAVSKLSRFSEQDRLDIEALAHAGLINARSLRKRADEALDGYVGNIVVLKNTIDIICRVLRAANPRRRN